MFVYACLEECSWSFKFGELTQPVILFVCVCVSKCVYVS